MKDDVPVWIGNVLPIEAGTQNLGSLTQRFGNIYSYRVTAEEMVVQLPNGDRVSVNDLFRRVRFLEHQVEKLTGAINILEAKEMERQDRE